MKQSVLIILCVFLLASCKDATQTSVEQQETTETATSKVINKAATQESKPKTNGTFLCKINGKDWSYTKASGIVSTHKKSKKRTAIITFTKQLEKGKEIVQLFYDGNTYKLEKASVHIKVDKKGGGKMTGMYQLITNSDLGTLDLTNPTAASGTTKALTLKILFEKGKLEDENMGAISLSAFNFSSIGYSNLDKF